MAPSARGVPPPSLLVATGHPLHTRTLALELFREDAATLRAAGTILDLRKCGFVPTGGEIQTAGIVHQMHWRAWLDGASGRIARLEIAQPVVAMERSAATGGECCRDPAPRLQALVGTAFDAGFARRLGDAFGGPLGCSHLLTLGQALGAFVGDALAGDTDAAARAPGERVAKRVCVLDGAERPDGALELAVQLADYRLAPQADARGPLGRFAFGREIRVLAEVALGDLRLAALRASARERDLAHLDAPWRELDGAVAPLAGGSALRGMAARIRARIAELPPGAERELLAQALLQLAPGLIQCLPALSHRGGAPLGRADAAGHPAAGAGEASPLLASGGMPDSCFMWRTGGAAARARFG